MIKNLIAALAALQFAAPLALVILTGALIAPATLPEQPAGCVRWDGELPTEIRLDARQVERAALIYAVSLEVGTGPVGAIVGIATAMQESSLGANPAAMTGPNADGDIGLFQQRSLVGWYADGTTQAENLHILADDRYQAIGFFTGHTTTSGWHIPGLQDITGWETIPITVAAQKVQISAHPDAYAQHETLARTLVDHFTTNPPSSVPCHDRLDPVLDCAPTGLASETGQTPDALRVMRCIHARWPQVGLLGVRPGDPRDHGTGRAVDVMIPNWQTPTGVALGTEIADWGTTNAAQFGITYVIWREHLWSTARADEGWRRCGTTASCYTGPNPSAAHLDHVHISVHGHTTNNAASSGAPEFVLPLDNYRLTARYGDTGPHWANRHTGLDFAAPSGTPLKAITTGTITAITRGGSYGNLTELTTPEGTSIYYAHQDRIHVRRGQQVAVGAVIGTVGATGNVTGAHLHLEIRVNDAPTDPFRWLRRQGLFP